MQISDEMKALEALARAYDHEEAACMGEPSPWVSADSEGDDEWKAERIVAARAGLDAYRSALSLPVQPVAWEGMDTAPKNGTMLRLLIQRGDVDRGAWASFEDSLDPYETIGFNALSDTLEDEWQFAGWDWVHDCFTDGAGYPVGWLPLTTPPVPPTKGPEDDLPEGWEGSADAMVWAKAYRYFVLKNNLTMSEAIDPDYMVGWFANYWAAIPRDRLEPSAEDDLIAAREAYAVFEDRCGFLTFAQEIRAGLHDDKSAVQSALLALRSRPASALPVVGDLKWDETEPSWHTTTTPFGCGYEVRISEKGTVRYRRTGRMFETFDGTFEAAKAAAQADFEARILAALTPSVQP